MNQIATNREQSERLLVCGVSPDTADMSWGLHKNDSMEDTLISRPHRTFKEPFRGECIVPAWSLSALLSLCPKEIYEDGDDCQSYYFSLAKEFPLTEEYGAAYIPCWDNGDAIVRKRDNTPIEAVVQLIEWLTANNYKLNTPAATCKDE